MDSGTPRGQETFSPALLDAVAYHRWVFETLAPWIQGRVLEVGSGHGTYTAHLRKAGHTVLVTDIDPTVCARLAVKFSHDPFVHVLQMDGIDERRIGQSAPIDTVLAINMLEHVPDDAAFVDAAAGVLRRLARDRGRLVTFSPAHQRLYGSLDRLAGHYRRYSVDDIQRLFVRVGLQVLTLRYFNPVGGLAWWLDAHLLHHQAIDSADIGWQLRFANRLVPASRFLDRLLQPSRFGQSVICVGEV
jgi:SAM-dependent methyltransferase